MGSLCASGGYYVAMAVGDEPDAIYAEPTTWTGSIGVIIPHYDLSGLLGRWNVKDDSIASGPLKQMGSPTKPMTDEDRKVLQATRRRQLRRLQRNRHERPAEVQGRSRGARRGRHRPDLHRQAGARPRPGRQDRLPRRRDQRAAELAGVSTDEVRCVKYEPPPTFVGELLGVRARRHSVAATRSIPPALLDLAAPRAYYLWTMAAGDLVEHRPNAASGQLPSLRLLTVRVHSSAQLHRRLARCLAPRARAGRVPREAECGIGSSRGGPATFRR